MMCKVLIFSCISAVMLMTAAYGAPLPKKEHLLETLIKDLKHLGERKDKIHFDLYTPNDKEECSWQTLQCYLTEMSILENEIEDNSYTLRSINKNLQSLMDLITPGTGCKICEANEKKLFPTFHEKLSNFLKSMFKPTR